VSQTLGLLATSVYDGNLVHLFSLPGCGACGVGYSVGMLYVGTVGADFSADVSAPLLRFRFNDPKARGCVLAFTDDATLPLLLVADDGSNAVHVVDVVDRRHVGYVGGLGSIKGPMGVATRGSMVAVSCWTPPRSGVHVVHLFEGGGSTWTLLRTIGGNLGRGHGQLHCPYGLRFTADGTGVAVADALNCRVSLFNVGDGSFVRLLATNTPAVVDIEPCEGGWLAVRGSSAVVFVGEDAPDGEHVLLGGHCEGTPDFEVPSALAWVPDLGLMVRDLYSVQVFATPNMIAMAAMSTARVAWMSVCHRGRCRE